MCLVCNGSEASTTVVADARSKQARSLVSSEMEEFNSLYAKPGEEEREKQNNGCQY